MKDYSNVRADVPKRRAAYGWFIFIAIVVFALSIADILFFDSILMYGVYAVYAVLFLWGVFLLFSRKREGEYFEHVGEEGWEELPDHTYLRCKNCQNIFEFGEDHLEERHEASFQCPVCGVYSHLPGRDASAVPAQLPEGPVREVGYRCTNCREHIVLGTFEEDPHYEVHFRACPYCQHRGTVMREDAFEEWERKQQQADRDALTS